MLPERRGLCVRNPVRYPGVKRGGLTSASKGLDYAITLIFRVMHEVVGAAFGGAIGW